MLCLVDASDTAMWFDADDGPQLPLDTQAPTLIHGTYASHGFCLPMPPSEIPCVFLFAAACELKHVFRVVQVQQMWTR